MSDTPAVARLSLTVLDCPDPPTLARFYGAITGWGSGEPDDPDWVTLAPEVGGGLAFQRVDEYRAPDWPGQAQPQQFHLDFDVADLDAAEARVLELGARKTEFQPGTTFRVYLDPAGHPFCLVLADM